MAPTMTLVGLVLLFSLCLFSLLLACICFECCLQLVAVAFLLLAPGDIHILFLIQPHQQQNPGLLSSPECSANIRGNNSLAPQ